MDAFRHCAAKLHLCPFATNAEESTYQRGEKGKLFILLLKYKQITNNLFFIYFIFQSLIMGEKSSVRYVTYQNDEEDE